MRKVPAILLPLLLSLTACGGATTEDATGSTAGASEVFDGVSVSGGSDDEAPTVEFESPLEITSVAAKTIAEGDGDEVEAGEQVQYRLVAVNAEDGEVLGDTYAEEPQVLPLDDSLKEELPELYEVLVGSNVGAQIAYTEPAPEPAEGASAGPQQLLVLKVISAEEPPPEPEVLSPEDVQKLDDEGQLPSFTFGEDGAPEVTIPENEPSGDLVVKVLEEGDGEVVAETDSITANYSGWTYSNGEQFDSSFERGEPASFPLNGVIRGWTEGLVGQKVGSKVLLVIPEPWAYPNPQQGQPPGPLVFYVEIVSKEGAE